MKAAWYKSNGEARDVLEFGEIATPSPGAGEVLVRLRTSGVNPSDVKSRRARPLTDTRIVPHSDGAGIIEMVGVGVDEALVGERVWIWNGQWNRAFGTAAEFIALPADQVVRLPERVDFNAGACMGIPGLTALHAVKLHGDIAGKTLLITGAAASVGYYAVQIAKAEGASVIGTASSIRSEQAFDAGCDAVIDYRSEDVAARVRELTDGRGADGIIDMDLSSTIRLLPGGVLTKYGKYVCYGSNVSGDVMLSYPAFLWGSLTLQAFVVYELPPEERNARLHELTEMLDAGMLKHMIGATYPLAEIVAAHEAVEGGKILGNVVLQIG